MNNIVPISTLSIVVLLSPIMNWEKKMKHVFSHWLPVGSVGSHDFRVQDLLKAFVGTKY